MNIENNDNNLDPISSENSDVQYNATETESDPLIDEVKGKKRDVIIGGIVLLAVILIAVGFDIFVYQKDAQNKTTVPQAVSMIEYNQEASEACKKVVDSNLKCEVKWVASDTHVRGELMKEAPAPGTKVDKNSNVVLTYSNGPTTAKFPAISGKDLEEAKKTLYDQGLTINKITEVDAQGIDKGKVVSTSIEAGTEVKNGTAVDIQISNGSITIPDWTGKTKEFVEADANKLGIDVEFVEEESDQTPNVVLSQTPQAGDANVSVPVNVTIAKPFESKTVKVPNVIGKSSAEAQSILAASGFRNIKTVTVTSSDVTTTQVTNVDPGVDQDANSEDLIIIIVSNPEGQ